MPTLELRPMTPAWHLPTIGGYEEPPQWRKWRGLIIAEYTTEQLFYALACVLPEAAMLRLVTEQKRTERLHGEALELRGL